MMPEYVRDVLRWLIGGGALALATLLGTTAYQQGQLKIEREKNLRQFLDNYVEIAIKGTLEERIRFVSYWESLEVTDVIGVDFARYRVALSNEIETENEFASASAQGTETASAAIEEIASATTVELTLPETADESVESQPAVRPPVRSLEPPPSVKQAYYQSRKSSVERSGAPDLERQGFEALLAKDSKAALAAFGRAAELWPDYHNVAEIKSLVESALPELSSPRSPKWVEIYGVILRDFSWGMPKDVRVKMDTRAD